MLFLFILAMVVILIIIIVAKGFTIVQQAEVVIIERLGRYHKTLESGVNIILPFLDKPRKMEWRYVVHDGRKTLYRNAERTKIDLRETVYDFPRQNIITKDNVGMEINALLYFQITDPVKAIYEITNLPDAIEKLTQTTLRNVLGELDLDQTLTSRDTINSKLRIILDEATDKWGVKVNRVELQDINPPQDIKNAMEKQMRAERDRRAAILAAEGAKRAAILRAEGERESSITEAEGKKQAAILEAEGSAEARLKEANAESDALKMIAQALGKESDPTRYLIALRYLAALSNISEGSEAKTVFLPYEASGILSSLGGIKELFKDIPAPAAEIKKPEVQ